MVNSSQDFIKQLAEINNSLRYSVFVPSLNESLFFKQLSTKQFKQILETINSPLLDINFNSVFVNILKDNIQEKDKGIIDQLTIYDLYIIALYTRIICISENYTIYISQEEKDIYNLTETSFNVNLKDVLESKNKTPIEQEIFSEGDISIYCDIPFQKVETETNNFIKAQFEENKKDISTENILGILFLNEITKCIRKVQLNDTEIIFNELTLEERKGIVEQLPITLINRVVKFIEIYKDVFADLFLLEITTNNKDLEPIKLQKVLEYNATLFNY
jgi:hypothetical protein